MNLVIKNQLNVCWLRADRISLAMFRKPFIFRNRFSTLEMNKHSLSPTSLETEC